MVKVMFADASAHISAWATLSAPVCAIYAARAANGAVGCRVAGPDHFAILSIAIAATCAVAAASLIGQGLSALLLMSGLAYFSVFDLRVLAVPVWPLIAYIVLGVLLPGLDGSPERALGAVIGWGSFTALSIAYRQLRGRVGLGEGDALVAAFLGAWLSFEGLVWSVALGALAGVIYVLFARRVDAPMPLVPALAAGACLFLIARSIAS